MTDYQSSSEFEGIERLSRAWAHWSRLGQLNDIAVSTSCPDCTVLFSSVEASFHLRQVDEGWSVDMVNDRGSRHDDWARFSNLTLAEKYLIWMWASAARIVLRAAILGQKLYALGFDPGVEAIPISPGTVELRSAEGQAVLIEPYATIFSHLMRKSEDEIEQMLTADL